MPAYYTLFLSSDALLLCHAYVMLLLNHVKMGAGTFRIDVKRLPL
jgi:hypothetical protein